MYVAGAATNPAASSFVPIAPCRLTDTRAASTVGPRSTPIGTAETVTLNVRGANGDCEIPANAVGVAANVTTVDGTVGSFLTIWPSDATKPKASTNNWAAGAPPTPNKVDVKLSAGGAVSVYNNAGTVNVIVDVVGYYEPSGLAGYEVVNKNTVLPSNNFLADGVNCPAGKRPLSGNYRLTSAPTFGAVRLVQSEITATGWGVVIENVGARTPAVNVTLQVVCATA